MSHFLVFVDMTTQYNMSSQSRRFYAFPSIGLNIYQELYSDSPAVLILVKLNIHKSSMLKNCITIFTI